MNKWIKTPLITGIIGAVLGIFFNPIKILPSQEIANIFSITQIIDGLIIGIVLGLIIALISREQVLKRS